ncbi:MAG: sulfite exporter TauE/SafE family protein [Hyphomicrobiaceae bacterium]
MTMPDAAMLAVIGVTFLLAGTVKGVIGLGLPTVSLGLLTAALDLPTAMALLLVPSLVTNVWQALAGTQTASVARRIWPFLIMAGGCVWIGALALTRADVRLLSALLGMLIFAYGSLSLAGVRLAIAPRHDAWAGPLIGAMNGVLTGMTGSFVVPGVMYLQAIGLPRDSLVQAMGMLFTISTLALGLALKGNNLLSLEHATLSTAALVPAVAGMIAGQSIRKRLPEAVFRSVFFPPCWCSPRSRRARAG